MKKKIAIINGVNLKSLGTREINIYGEVDFDTYFSGLKDKYSECELIYFQSDKVEELVNMLFSCSDCDAILLNPGAYTHTSIILADTIRAINVPVIEVHISNLFSRENYRRKSFISSVSRGFISGFGLKSYELALLSVIH